MVVEGKVELDFDIPENVSKKLPVFYNPVMKLNRDISIEVLKILGKDRPLRIALPLAGSGVRGLRFIAESSPYVGSLHINDYMSGFTEAMRKRFRYNNLDDSLVHYSEKDANVFLLESKGFDYIDVDPFGTPNPFLDASVQRIARGGILAVTATDTSALAGTYAAVCRRNYYAEPIRNWLKHFSGLRILARKVQLVGAQYEKALYPVFSYSKDHYYRIFFRCVKSKKEATALVNLHKYLIYDDDSLEYSFSSSSVGHGKMYSGSMWEEPYSSIGLIKYIDSESSCPGRYVDIHAICKANGWSVPSFSELRDSLSGSFSRTHLSDKMIKTDVSNEELMGAIKKLVS